MQVIKSRCQASGPRVGRLAIFAALLLLIFPAALLAYVGPGAGFAVVSSFLSLFLAFLYSLIALFTWPFRRIVRWLRRRKAFARAKVKRVVIIGFDGLDPDLATRYMDEGKLPNFAKLREKGSFLHLQTTIPPISPVAWSSFLTGVNPGKHRIYDFLGRDCASYLPYLSSAQIREPKRRIKLGKYVLPIGKPQIRALRRGRPFWELLGEVGVFCSVLRVPVTFPPEPFSGVLLSGMCVPDLKGTQGTFAFYSTRSDLSAPFEGGRVLPFEKNGSGLRSRLFGPEDPFLPGANRELHLDFTLRPEPQHNRAVLELEGQRFMLKLGEYSEWIPLQFRSALGMPLRGIVRFYLKELSPHVELYVTPINIDPQKPALPISHPSIYSVYLSKLQGRFSTLGLAEDTWALNEHALDEEAFLEQCYLIHDERERMFFDALEKTRQGVCVCVFDITDRVQHMFWRYTEADHPGNRDPAKAAKFAGTIEELYRRMDGLLGRAMQSVDSDTILFVLSDHGFKSFQRGINVNAWLHQNGYLALKNGASGGSDGEWFHDVDWSRTRAYAMGLNGLYLNLAGRERQGIVRPEEASGLKRQLLEKLTGLADPENGRTGIREVYDTEHSYSGPYRPPHDDAAPDLIIGYAKGYRASWDGVKGRVTSAVFEDNPKAWSGDHCIDPHLVPGVLFSNRRIAQEHAAIVDLAPTVLELFGVKSPANFDGKALKVVL